MANFAETLQKISGNKNVYEGVTDIMEAEDWINTGSLLFNYQIHANQFGLPSNRIIMLVGDEHTGKTFLAANAALNAIRGNTKLGQPYKVIWFEAEGATNKETLFSIGFTKDDIKNFVWAPVFTVEEWRHDMYAYLRAKQRGEIKDRLIMITDSLGNLSSEKEVTDVESDNKKEDMTRAKRVNSTFRLVTLLANQVQVPMIIINHYYDSQSFIPQTIVGGGKKASLNPSYLYKFTKSQIKESTDIVGVNVTSTTLKSRGSKFKAKVEIPIYFDKKLEYLDGIEDYLIKMDLIGKTQGGWTYKSKKYTKNNKVELLEKVYKEHTEDINNFLNKEFRLGA